jgi:hypothetical protein
MSKHALGYVHAFAWACSLTYLFPPHGRAPRSCAASAAVTAARGSLAPWRGQPATASLRSTVRWEKKGEVVRSTTSYMDQRRLRDRAAEKAARQRSRALWRLQKATRYAAGST